MKKLVFLVSFVLIASICFSQIDGSDFEGTIIFKSKYESKNPNLTSQQLANYFGDSSIVYIKGNHYKQIYFNSAVINQTIYEPESNRYYFLFNQADTLLYADCGEDTSSYAVNKLKDSDIEVLGYKCNGIKISSEQIIMTFYYTPKLRLENADFSKHIMGGYNKLYENTKSIYLMSESIHKDYISSNKAIKIEEKKLDDNIFVTPDLPIKKL